MKVYLAGPMSGYEGLNFAHFHEMAAQLRAAGHDVVNPAEINGNQDAGWLSCMQADICQLVYCDGIALLAGWDKSKGATLEHHIAASLGRSVYSAYDLAKIPAASLIALKVRGEVCAS